MNELLGYLTNDVARHGRELKNLEKAFSKQTKLNLLAAVFIFACICKIGSMGARIKALEGETE